MSVTPFHSGVACRVLANREEAGALAAACCRIATALPAVGACDLLGDPAPLPPPGTSVPPAVAATTVVLGVDWTAPPALAGAALARWLSDDTLPPGTMAALREGARYAALSWRQDGTTAALQHALHDALDAH